MGNGKVVRSRVAVEDCVLLVCGGLAYRLRTAGKYYCLNRKNTFNAALAVTIRRSATRQLLDFCVRAVRKCCLFRFYEEYTLSLDVAFAGSR